MSIGSSILNILKSVLKIGAQEAPAIISAYSPALGSLASIVLGALVSAEGAVPGAGQGSVKSTVSNLLLEAKGSDIAAIFSGAGKPIANPTLFSDGVADLQAAILKILNSTGVDTKPAT